MLVKIVKSKGIWKGRCRTFHPKKYEVRTVSNNTLLFTEHSFQRAINVAIRGRHSIMPNKLLEIAKGFEYTSMIDSTAYFSNGTSTIAFTFLPHKVAVRWFGADRGLLKLQDYTWSELSDVGTK